MRFERGNDIKTTLRIGRVANAVELDYIFAVVNVRPASPEPIMNITVTVSSTEDRFIPFIQNAEFEKAEQRILLEIYS